MNKKGKIVLILILVLIIVAGAVFFSTKNDANAPAITETTGQTNTETNTSATPNEVVSPYKDGRYTAMGTYSIPGGTEEVEVTVELQQGIIRNSSVKIKAKAPQSKQFQDKFISGFASQVIGKKIDDLNLKHVSGSSLTPKGFNDAISKIKVEASA